MIEFNFDNACKWLYVLMNVAIIFALFFGGAAVNQRYEELRDEYDQCINNLNCTNECSVRGCRLVGCDLWYCPKEPVSASFFLYMLGGLYTFIVGALWCASREY